jgi:hypothetical protein
MRPSAVQEPHCVVRRRQRERLVSDAQFLGVDRQARREDFLWLRSLQPRLARGPSIAVPPASAVASHTVNSFVSGFVGDAGCLRGRGNAQRDVVAQIRQLGAVAPLHLRLQAARRAFAAFVELGERSSAAFREWRFRSLPSVTHFGAVTCASLRRSIMKPIERRLERSKLHSRDTCSPMLDTALAVGGIGRWCGVTSAANVVCCCTVPGAGA